MATRTAFSVADNERWVVRYVWQGLLNGDDGEPIKLAVFADRSVQVIGTFGTGGSLSIEGSNDGGTTWATLKDPFAANITFTAAGLKTVGDLPYQIRPHVTAGDGNTDLDCYLMIRSSNR